MKAILLKFKVFERDWDWGNKRVYKDVALNPKNIICVYEEFDRDAQRNDTVIEFDRESTTPDRKSPISIYRTEENLHSLMDRVNRRQFLEITSLPSMPKKNDSSEVSS